MSSDVIVFRDRSENVERHMCLNALTMHAKAAPTILMDPSKIGSSEMVEASKAARSARTISVFEYREKYYVLTGQDQIDKLIKEAGETREQTPVIPARLITKHLAKKATPSTRRY